MAQFDLNESDLHVPLLIAYTWTPIQHATHSDPEEGGVEDVHVFIQHPTDPQKNVDITGFLSQDSLDRWTETCWNHGEAEVEERKAQEADAAYDRQRDREDF